MREHACGAVVLLGGRSSRMGFPKARLVRDGLTQAARVVADCTARGVAPVLLVGDRDLALTALGGTLPGGVHVTREDPPFGGPAAGVVAGMTALAARGTREAVVLAIDLVDPAGVLESLLAAEPGPDGVLLVDEDGWRQPLAARYRVAALAGREDVRDLSMRRLVAGLDLAEIAAPAGLCADVDDPAQARRRGLSPAAGADG